VALPSRRVWNSFGGTPLRGFRPTFPPYALTFACRLSESSTTHTPAVTPYRLSKTCTLICNSNSQGTLRPQWSSQIKRDARSSSTIVHPYQCRRIIVSIFVAI
jgi:hypothetical protein